MRIVRTSIEATVLATGFLLGGTVGIGTVLYALAIGPITHHTMPALAIDRRGVTVASPGRSFHEDAPLAPPPIQFTVDRSFVFVLRDTETGAVLFIGIVSNP